MFILVDCNSFFVSCELVFKPFLKGKPVAVLSNNDGCIIARSPEVKALGIPMGAPYFKYEELFKRHKVVLFSSNYTLYGDMSARVMETLASFETEMEIYSIDEAFLWYDGTDLHSFCHEIREKVKKWTTIPVSVGAGPTKTLAKAANELAKSMKTGIFSVAAMDPCLSTLEVKEIWGVGRSTAALLNAHQIFSAEQFAKASDLWIRQQLGVVGLRTAMELRGVSCLALEEAAEPKKGVVSSRSFGQAVMDLEALLESVSYHASHAAEKIRSEGSAASYLQVYFLTSRFDPKHSSFSRVATVHFPEPTSFTPSIIEAAKKAIAPYFIEGIPYKKSGVFLGGLVPDTQKPLSLFEGWTQAEREKQERLMGLLDKLNEKKSGSLFFLAEGIEKGWKMRRSILSPSYTTSWEDLPKVKAD